MSKVYIQFADVSYASRVFFYLSKVYCTKFPKGFSGFKVPFENSSHRFSLSRFNLSDFTINSKEISLSFW